MHGKFKFCFLELFVIFFISVFDLELIEPTDAEPADMEGQLYFPLLKF